MNETKCVIRCRKCREILFNDDCIIKTSPIVEDLAETHHDLNLWYLDPESCPEWIYTAIYQSDFTQGKLFCPQCHAKVGAFNYTSPYGSGLSPVHTVKCKVDLMPYQAPIDLPQTVRSDTMAIVYQQQQQQHKADTEDQTESDSGEETSVLKTSVVKFAGKQPPHRRSLSTGALRPLLATASNFNSSLSLTNPLSLLSRGESERSDCVQQTDEAGTSLLENLFAIGQAAVEAANLSHGIEDNSDDDVSQGASQHSDEHDSQHLHSNHDTDSNSDQNQTLNEGPELSLSQTSELQVVHDVILDKTENYQLMCPVCLEHYYNPHKCLPCKHVFCDPCLRRMRKTDMNSPTKCPLCRVVIKKCIPHSVLSSMVTSTFPDVYHSRHKLEKKQKHKLPPLPGEAVTIDNRYGQNMLATWSAVCGIVLLMMFIFCVFASLVGFVLWYMMEVVLDVAGELLMEISDLFSFSWQALIILYLEGQMPHNIQEVMSGCASRIFGTLSRLIDRTKVFFTEGEVSPPSPVTIYIIDPQIHFSNHTQVLTKVAQADLVNYVFLAGLVTYIFYRIGRYLQNMNVNANGVRVR